MPIEMDFPDDLRAELKALDAIEALLDVEFWAAIHAGDGDSAGEHSRAITRVWVHRANLMQRVCLINAPLPSLALH
jgi:hypothetical protein